MGVKGGGPPSRAQTHLPTRPPHPHPPTHHPPIHPPSHPLTHSLPPCAGEYIAVEKVEGVYKRNPAVEQVGKLGVGWGGGEGVRDEGGETGLSGKGRGCRLRLCCCCAPQPQLPTPGHTHPTPLLQIWVCCHHPTASTIAAAAAAFPPYTRHPAADPLATSTPMLQIWVYGSSFEPSLVAVVVPVAAKLQVGGRQGGWVGARGVNGYGPWWAAATLLLPCEQQGPARRVASIPPHWPWHLKAP